MRKFLFFISLVFLFSCQKELNSETLPLNSVSLNGASNPCNSIYSVQAGANAKTDFLNYLVAIKQLRNSGDTTPKTICIDNDVEIIFGNGTNVAEFFDIPEGVTLKSNGAKFISNDKQNNFSFSKIENSNITIDGIVFKAPLSITAWQNGLDIAGTQQNVLQNITIKNCDLSGFNQFAIAASNATNVTVQNNYIHHNFGVFPVGHSGYGVNVISGSSIEIINNRFLYNRHAVASSNLTDNSHYIAKNNVVLAEYEGDPIVRNYSEKQVLFDNVLNSAHHFDAHGINNDGESGTGKTTGTFVIEQNTIYNTRPFSTDPHNGIIDIRGVPRDCSSISNNAFQGSGNTNNIRQQNGDNSYVKSECSNNDWKNITVSSNTYSNEPLSTEVDNLIVVKESGDLINYPLFTDLYGEGVLAGNGFLPSTYENFLVGYWTNNGSSDLMVRNSNGDLFVYPFGNGSFYNQGNPNQVGSGFLNFTDYLVGRWSSGPHSDLIARKNDGKLYRYTSDGNNLSSQGVVGYGFNFEKYLVGNWTSNSTSDLMTIDGSGKLRLYRYNSTSFSSLGVKKTNFIYDKYFPGKWTDDNISDIITLDTNGNLWLYEFDGTNFFNKILVGDGFNFEDYCVGDFTGDGIDDLLTIDEENSIYLYPFKNDTFYSNGGPIKIGNNLFFEEFLVGRWGN